MLYDFLLNYVELFGFLNVFKYITFRTGLAVFTSLVIVLLIGGPFIKLFSDRKILNPIREDGPSDHIIKKNWYTYDGRCNYFNWLANISYILGRFKKYLCFILSLYCFVFWITWSI